MSETEKRKKLKYTYIPRWKVSLKGSQLKILKPKIVVEIFEI